MTTSTPDAEKPRLLSVKAAAATMSVSPTTVRRMVNAGTLRHVRIGDRVLITPAAIDELIDAASA